MGVPVVEVTEDRDPRSHWKQQPVGGPVLLTDVYPAPIGDHEPGRVAGLCSTRHRHVGMTGRWLPSASTRAYCTLSPCRAGMPCRAWRSATTSSNEGMAHVGGRSVVEQQRVVPGCSRRASEPGGQVAQAVLDRIPQLVHDVAVDTCRR